jgi:hypothetical protein
VEVAASRPEPLIQGDRYMQISKTLHALPVAFFHGQAVAGTH